MKKEMSSFDIRSVVTDLSALEGAHMDKIFHWGSGNVLFRLNVQGVGKKDLFFKDKKWLYLAPEKPATPITPTSFATFLRKYIDNARIGKTMQMGFDRIVVMEIFKADAEYKLIFELFGGGNILLVLDNKIVNCLIHKTFRDRATRPGENYHEPKARFDPITATEEEFAKEFRNSEADTVRTLATVVNLGGQYAEEVCRRSGIDKNKPIADVTYDEMKRLYSELRGIVELITTTSEPTAVRIDGKLEDVSPVSLAIYEGEVTEHYDTMSLAIAAYLKETDSDKELEYVDPEIEKLEKRIAKQQETVMEYKESSDDLRRHADALYADYQKADELLKVMNEQSKKLPWDKLEAGAMKIPYVTAINPSKNTITATLADISVTMDYTKGLDANASEIYQKSKDIGEKAKRAQDALDDSTAEMEKRMKGLERDRAIAMTRVQPTKQFWFERYKWFITTDGKLVIAGRDAHTNDNIVKKHLKEGDVFAHADLHGAPSVILKEGNDASPTDLRETCAFALTQSKAWVAAMAEGTAFWAYPDQVSKTPNPGEFVPRGAFIVRGKRNYENHLKIELAVAEIDYEGARKIMCGPLESVEGRSAKYFVIRPGRGKSGRKAGDIAKEFQVPEEEISRILPPGDVEIERKVWPKEDAE